MDGASASLGAQGPRANKCALEGGLGLAASRAVHAATADCATQPTGLALAVWAGLVYTVRKNAPKVNTAPAARSAAPVGTTALATASLAAASARRESTDTLVNTNALLDSLA